MLIGFSTRAAHPVGAATQVERRRLTTEDRRDDDETETLGAAPGGALTLTTTSVALAGEVTGTGKPTQGVPNANSICVFSGKNDDPNAPLISDPILAPNGPGGPSQSYGQEVRLGFISPHQFNPGDACRGGSNFARQK